MDDLGRYAVAHCNRMPPGRALSDVQIELVRGWIEAGAMND